MTYLYFYICLLELVIIPLIRPFVLLTTQNENTLKKNEKINGNV